MPFFKRQQTVPCEGMFVGKTQVVAMKHDYGCPLYKPSGWFNHVTHQWIITPYTPTSDGCTPRCRLYPGPAPGPYEWNPWPAAPAGFIWKIVRFTEPQQREWPFGKLAKWHRPKGRWTFTGVSGRIHGVGIRGEKNWKLLYTRHVKVKRARQLGFEYGVSSRDEE
jgi:hypothetical protein